MVNLCLDTSIFIDYFLANKGFLSELEQSSSPPNHSLSIPAIVVFEIFKGESAGHPEFYGKFSKLISTMTFHYLTLETAITAGTLERSRFAFGFDAIIAATCLEHDLTLVTLNSKHFRAVPGLKLFA